MATNFIRAESPSKAEQKPVRHGSLAQPCAELSANQDLQNEIPIVLRKNQNYVNPPAGGQDANSAAPVDLSLSLSLAAIPTSNAAAQVRRNWADITEEVNPGAEEGFTLVQGRKRRRGSGNSPTTAAPSSNAGASRTIRRPQSSAGSVPRAQEIRATRAHIADARARQASSSEEHCVYIEHSPELEPFHYLRALDRMLGGTAGVIQITKVNGHQLLGLTNRGLAERLISEGLEVEGTLLRAFPFRKRAERITVGNLPFFVADSAVITALSPYGRVTSIAPKQMKAGPYVYVDGRRDVFITLHEGITIERLPTRLDINIKGQAWPAYLSSGIRCSRCHGQGHRRAICPLLAGLANNTRTAPPTTPAGVPPPTTPAPPQRSAAQPPAPAPSNLAMEVCSAPPMARAVLHPSAPRPSPPATPALPMEETPSAPPPVIPAPSLQVPKNPVDPRSATPRHPEPTPPTRPDFAAPHGPPPIQETLGPAAPTQDVEMSIVEETTASSASSTRNATGDDLVAFIEGNPSVSFARTDALGLGREEVLDLLSSRTKAQRNGPLLSPPQCDALVGLIGQILDLKPGHTSNLYKVLGQVRAELTKTPAAAPTPPLPAPRPTGPTPPVPHEEQMAEEQEDVMIFKIFRKLKHMTCLRPLYDTGIDVIDLKDAILFTEDTASLMTKLSPALKGVLAEFLGAAIELARSYHHDPVKSRAKACKARLTSTTMCRIIRKSRFAERNSNSFEKKSKLCKSARRRPGCKFCRAGRPLSLAAIPTSNAAAQVRRNWADITEEVNPGAEEGFTLVQGRKRRRGSGNSPTTAAPSSNAGASRTIRRPQSSAGSVPRAQEIRATRAHIADARARQASSSEEHCVYIEHSPELEPFHYLRALDRMLGGTAGVIQITKVNGHQLLGLTNRGLAERLISEGLEVEGTLLRAFPFRKRAERITVGNLPFFVADSAVITALSPYGRVTSIAPKQMKAGPYVYVDGRRDVFITLHEGITIERLPTRLDINIKGQAWPAYLSSGIRCSRCHGQGHRRAICPLLAGLANNTRTAPPTTPAGVPPPTTPAPPQRSAAQPPAPAPSNLAMEVCSAPPMARAVLHPSAPRPSPPATPALPMEETPTAPPPVIPAPSLQVPKNPVDPRSATPRHPEPTPPARPDFAAPHGPPPIQETLGPAAPTQDVEMSIVEETTASSASSTRNATGDDLVAFIEGNPSVSFARTDALGLGREEVLDLLSSRTKAQRNGPLLSPPQCDALVGLIGQILDLKPGHTSNLYKVLGQVRAELTKTPAAAPTPPLPAPRPTGPTPPVPHEEQMTEEQEDVMIFKIFRKLKHMTCLRPLYDTGIDVIDLKDAILFTEDTASLMTKLSPALKGVLAEFLGAAIELARSYHHDGEPPLLDRPHQPLPPATAPRLPQQPSARSPPPASPSSTMEVSDVPPASRAAPLPPAALQPSPPAPSALPLEDTPPAPPPVTPAPSLRTPGSREPAAPTPDVEMSIVEETFASSTSSAKNATRVDLDAFIEGHPSVSFAKTDALGLWREEVLDLLSSRTKAQRKGPLLSPPQCDALVGLIGQILDLKPGHTSNLYKVLGQVRAELTKTPAAAPTPPLPAPRPDGPIPPPPHGDTTTPDMATPPPPPSPRFIDERWREVHDIIYDSGREPYSEHLSELRLSEGDITDAVICPEDREPLLRNLSTRRKNLLAEIISATIERARDIHPFALSRMATNFIRAESPSKAEQKPVRHGSLAQPYAELSANQDLQNEIPIVLRKNQNYVNPPAGGQDANSAAPVDLSLAAIPTSNAAAQVRRNWADITEQVNPGAEEGFTLVQGRKRRRGSGNSPTTAAPSSNAGASRTIRRPQSSAGSVPRAQEIRATRAHIADARARQASSSEEHCVYIEHSPELEPFHYLRALDRKLGGTAGVIQITKVNGHQLLGLTNRGLAERLISEGLEVEGTLLRAFPFRKRAERITVGNLPFFVADSAVITALSPFGRVTSIAPKQMKAGPYVYVDGRRDVFITLHEGITIERLPTRLDINIKGQAWPAYLSSGIRCSRCHGQGHRRAICPLLAGLANNTRMAPPTTPAGVPPPTTSAPPQRSAAQPLAPAPSNLAMEVCSAPPMARAVLHPSAPRSSPPAAPALPMEETPSAPPPVIPAPSLQVPKNPVDPRSATPRHPEPTPPARPDFAAPRGPPPIQETLGPAAPTHDVEMSIVEETTASSASSTRNATRVDLDAFIEVHPSVSFAETDALGLGREEVLDLLSSRTKAQRKGPLLSPPQCDALAGLIGQILDLKPGHTSNLYKVLGQVRAELTKTPAAAPTPPLPAPRPAEMAPPAPQGEESAPAEVAYPPPLPVKMTDEARERWLLDLFKELNYRTFLIPLLSWTRPEQIIRAALHSGEERNDILGAHPNQRSILANFLGSVIERARGDDQSALDQLSDFSKNGNEKIISKENSENRVYANPPTGVRNANLAAARGDVTTGSAAATSSNGAARVLGSWADSIEDQGPGEDDDFTVIKNKKRRRESPGSPAAAAPSSGTRGAGATRRPRSSTGWAPRAEEIRTTRAHIVEARARQASSTEDHCVYVERSPELEPFHYMRAIERMFGGTREVFQLTKMNGHFLVGLANRGMAERLVNEGLEVEGTLHRAFPFRKRAERITVGNLPFFVGDAAVISALSSFGRVTSLAPKLMKAGPYIYNDGRREAFIILREGMTIERLPTRLEITIKGEAWPAYLSSGIRCSRCRGQGHRRANCPLLARRTTAPGPATPTSPTSVPPATAPRLPQQPSAQPPPPASPSPTMEVSDVPPTSRAALHPPEALRQSPPAPSALPAEDAPPAPPPVTPDPSLRTPGSREPAAPTPDVEMSIVEETFASSTSSAKNATRVDLDAFIEGHPSVSFAKTDALGLGREEVLDLLSSRTKAQRKGPLLSPPQCDALVGLIGQILDLKPGHTSNLYKVLGQVRAELTKTPAAAPTPPLPAPRPDRPIPPPLHGDTTTPDMATPPPPPSAQMEVDPIDKRCKELQLLTFELMKEFNPKPLPQFYSFELDFVEAYQTMVGSDSLYCKYTTCLHSAVRPRVARALCFSPLAGGEMHLGMPSSTSPGSSGSAGQEPGRPSVLSPSGYKNSLKNELHREFSRENSANKDYANPPTGVRNANLAAARGDVTTGSAAATSSNGAARVLGNWADYTEDQGPGEDDDFTVVKNKKRRRESPGSPAATAPSSGTRGARATRRPRSSTGWAPRAEEVRTTRAHIAEARARQASSTEDHCVFVERSPELEPYHYMRAIDRMFGSTREFFQVTKMNGHFLVGLASKGMAERLVNEGLEVEGTLHRAFPFRKRAERITVGNLPFFVGDAAVISALSSFGRVTSIAPKLMKAGPYVYNDGRREAFIILREGMTIERLPTRLNISTKGEAWPAYLSSGIRCSRCRGQGHRRANCPMLAGRTTALGPDTPTSPTSVPPATAPRLPQQPSAQPPPPASPSSMPPASRAAPLPPAALQPSPPAPSALPVEDAPPAPPPVTPAPSLRTPGSREPAAPTPDVEMSIAEETSASSTSSAKNATRVDLDAFIEKHPSVSFAGTDALGLGREEVLDLLSSRTKAQRKGPLLSPPQCDALAGLIGQILDLRPGAASNLYKVLGQVKAELRTTPAAVPPTPPLPAPRPAEPMLPTTHREELTPPLMTPRPPAPTDMEDDDPITEEERCAPPPPAPRLAGPIPPVPHGDTTTPAMTTPPPPLSLDRRWKMTGDLIHELSREIDLEHTFQSQVDMDDIVRAVLYPGDREPFIKRLPTRDRYILSGFINTAIWRARDGDPSMLE
ncbi:hypothetical protein LAZ67_1002155, partial [Cordylochernes scorpioides]